MKWLFIFLQSSPESDTEPLSFIAEDKCPCTLLPNIIWAFTGIMLTRRPASSRPATHNHVSLRKRSVDTLGLLNINTNWAESDLCMAQSFVDLCDWLVFACSLTAWLKQDSRSVNYTDTVKESKRCIFEMKKAHMIRITKKHTFVPYLLLKAVYKYIKATH